MAKSIISNNGENQLMKMAKWQSSKSKAEIAKRYRQYGISISESGANSALALAAA